MAPDTLTKEFRGVELPAGIDLPSTAEILDVCSRRGRRTIRGLAYPSEEKPLFWIKYGHGVYWNEVIAMTMARKELQRLESPVRVPAVFYAFQANYQTYIVMEYISGWSGTQILEATSVPTEREAVYRQIAAGIQELLRIPAPPQSSPAAVDGGLIRHLMFDEQEAPRRYQTVEQLEQHLNLFLEITKSKLRVQEPPREPMASCLSDTYPGNFIVADSHVTVIDFSEANFLPFSFAKYAIKSSLHGPEYDISPWIDVPCTEGVDNTDALFALAYLMTVGPGSFATIGERIPGYDASFSYPWSASPWVLREKHVYIYR